MAIQQKIEVDLARYEEIEDASCVRISEFLLSKKSSKSKKISMIGMKQNDNGLEADTGNKIDVSVATGAAVNPTSTAEAANKCSPIEAAGNNSIVTVNNVPTTCISETSAIAVLGPIAWPSLTHAQCPSEAHAHPRPLYIRRSPSTSTALALQLVQHQHSNKRLTNTPSHKQHIALLFVYETWWQC